MLLDAVVNNVFKKMWAKISPMNLRQGVKTAKKIVDELNRTNLCEKYVHHYPVLCEEIISKNGGPSYHM